MSSISLSSLELRHRSCDCLNRNHNCDDHFFISLSVKALRQNVRTDGKNVRALAQTVGVLVKSVRALAQTVRALVKTLNQSSKPLNIRQPSVSFKPFNGQSLVYVFPWKVTNSQMQRALQRLLIINAIVYIYICKKRYIYM